ncbi:hypothetical protein PYCC9005_004954 [Savitreella phatthalungensis]
MDADFALSFKPGAMLAIDRLWTLKFEVGLNTAADQVTDQRTCAFVDSYLQPKTPADIAWVSYRLFSMSNRWTDTLGGGLVEDSESEAWLPGQEYRRITKAGRTMVSPPDQQGAAIVNVRLDGNCVVVTAEPAEDASKPLPWLGDIGIILWLQLRTHAQKQTEAMVAVCTDVSRSLPFYDAVQAVKMPPGLVPSCDEKDGGAQVSCRQRRGKTVFIAGCAVNVGPCSRAHQPGHDRHEFYRGIQQQYSRLRREMSGKGWLQRVHRFIDYINPDNLDSPDAELLNSIKHVKATREL